MGNVKDNIASHALAEHPPWDLQDAKGMSVQQRFRDMKTPEELLKALPVAKPLDRGVFLKPKEGGGACYRFDVNLFRSIPKFEWNQLYNLPTMKSTGGSSIAGVPPPTTEPSPLTAADADTVEC